MHIIKELVLASNNDGKIQELTQLLSPLDITIIGGKQAEIGEIEETGSTFAENAIIKAESASKSTGLPALGDDSGLCVDALNGSPGIFTARYGDYHKLLDEMSEIPFEERTAQFICALALAIPGRQTVVFEGKVDGFVLTHPRGDGGFGYDPVFLPVGEQRSFAEMDPHQKHALSHRGRALREFIGYLERGMFA